MKALRFEKSRETSLARGFGLLLVAALAALVAVGCGGGESGEAGAVEGTIQATTTHQPQRLHPP